MTQTHDRTDGFLVVLRGAGGICLLVVLLLRVVQIIRVVGLVVVVGVVVVVGLVVRLVVLLVVVVVVVVEVEVVVRGVVDLMQEYPERDTLVLSTPPSQAYFIFKEKSISGVRGTPGSPKYLSQGCIKY